MHGQGLDAVSGDNHAVAPLLQYAHRDFLVNHIVLGKQKAHLFPEGMPGDLRRFGTLGIGGSEHGRDRVQERRRFDRFDQVGR